jgi:hypothetical protein
MVSVSGRIFCSSAELAPLPSRLVAWQCVDGSQRHVVELDAFLSSVQVRALDERRDGKGDFELQIELAVQVDGGLGTAPATTVLVKKVTSSDWSRVLSEMKFEDRATFEVPLSGGRVGPPLDKAAAFLGVALDKIQQRQWADALTKCREMLEEVEKLGPERKPEWAEWADANQRKSWGTGERLMATQKAVRHLTHVGPHSEIGAADENTVRCAVGFCALLLRYHAAR